VGVNDRSYSYTVLATDTLFTVRDALVALINADPEVTAAPSGEYTRIIIRARVQGPEGNNIKITATQTGTGTTILMTPFEPALCCANVGGTLVTQDNPASAGEFIIVYATGLGLPDLTDPNVQAAILTGMQYPVGAPVTVPTSAGSAIAGGFTADVVTATLQPGTVGIYQILLHLNASLTSNNFTTLTFSQDTFTSKTVTFPVRGQ